MPMGFVVSLSFSTSFSTPENAVMHPVLWSTLYRERPHISRSDPHQHITAFLSDNMKMPVELFNAYIAHIHLKEDGQLDKYGGFTLDDKPASHNGRVKEVVDTSTSLPIGQ